MADRYGIIAVIGPTASGKSALALELARQTGGEVLSVDSMQVYHGLDIGTAKPTPQERASVRHHAIDLVEPTEGFTVARFVAHADSVIDDAARRRVPLIAVGGTPMYFKALFEGLFEGPAADPDVRDRLTNRPLAELHARLLEVDPDAAMRIHVNDRKRLVRALEVYELTGKPISIHQREWGLQQRHAAKWVGLLWDRDLLNRRINTRVKEMIQAGWVREVAALLARHGRLSRTASEATGYAELIDHLSGATSLADTIEQIKIATRQLARRQMKWFRRFESVSWLDGRLPTVELVTQVLRASTPGDGRAVGTTNDRRVAGDGRSSIATATSPSSKPCSDSGGL